MKVFYPVIANHSGADVYFERLAGGLRACGAEPTLRFYPHLLEFLPYRALQPFFPTVNGFDVVHSKAEYGWLFARGGPPLVVTLAHSVFDPAYTRAKGAVRRLYHGAKLRANIAHSFERAARVVTVSRFSQQRIQEAFGRNDVRVIYNGVEEDFYRPASDTEPRPNTPVRLLFVGNLTARKGADLLPRILERLGRGHVLEYTSGLRTGRTLARQAGLIPLGRLGPRGLLEAYRRCDIFLFPSRLEGFGYPVAEAMACAKPIVATNYSSLPELVDDGQGGYLCPLDDVEAFVDRIRQLAARPELRARMGVYNRAKIERGFTLRQTVHNYLALYRELL